MKMIDQYELYWNKAYPAMTEKLAEIESAMSASLFNAGFEFDKEVYKQGDEEFKMCRLIQDGEGDVIAALEFNLFDANAGGGGRYWVGVGLKLIGFNAQPLVLYHPGCYTDDAFTDSEDEMLERITSLDAGSFAEYAIGALADEELIAEFKRDRKASDRPSQS